MEACGMLLRTGREGKAFLGFFHLPGLADAHFGALATQIGSGIAIDGKGSGWIEFPHHPRRRACAGPDRLRKPSGTLMSRPIWPSLARLVGRALDRSGCAATGRMAAGTCSALKASAMNTWKRCRPPHRTCSPPPKAKVCRENGREEAYDPLDKNIRYVYFRCLY